MLVKFEIYHDGDYWCGRGIGEDIFTQGKTLDDLMVNIEEAVYVHYEDVIEGGDHSFKTPKSSGLNPETVFKHIVQKSIDWISGE